MQQQEKREFRIHKDILWSIIKSQAGTLQKAILELVMNSIDAGASKVEIVLASNTLQVTDDGKGFTSRQEIEEFFETFGTPHQEGDARYGRFRMGRGQIMAFTRNTWRSGQFAMDVDIRDMGLAYHLAEMPAAQSGCSISCELYEPLKPSELIQTQDALRQLCKYAPIPVLVNNEQVSVDLNKEKWTFEDDDAWYLLRESARKLDVYNLGIHVTDYSTSFLGTGGIVVSKHQLQVNFARNDILAKECKVWKRIAARVQAHVKSTEGKAPVQNEAYRGVMMDRLLSGQFESGEEFYDALVSAKVFTDHGGRHLSLFGLKDAIDKTSGLLVDLSAGHAKADRVHQSRLALVLSPRTRSRADWKTMPEILKRIEQNTKLFPDFGGWCRREKIQQVTQTLEDALVDIDTAARSLSDQHRIVEDKELSKEERVALKMISHTSAIIARAAGVDDRTIRVCECDSADGFTDGFSTIFIERKFLKIGGAQGHGFHAFHAIGSLLLHEFGHDNASGTGHDHPQEFYQAFHDKVDVLGVYAYQALNFWVSERRRAGMRLRVGDTHAMDLMSMQAA